jgi:hypothetical protein
VTGYLNGFQKYLLDERTRSKFEPVRTQFTASTASREKPGTRLTLSVASSSLIHVAVFYATATYLSLPSLGVEFTLPSQVEFGLAEQTKLSVPANAPSTPSASRSDPNSQKKSADFAAKEAKEKKKKAAKPKPAQKKPSLAVDGGVAETTSKGKDGPPLTQYAPAGAQIALRIDMERIRNSPIAEDVRQVLAVVPDWQLILGGSGIDPIEQLNRLFIASPNLKRSSLVVAGQYNGAQDVAQKAVASLAASAGKAADWQTDGTVTYAPWLNQDETERVVALVGPQQFVISTPADLPRVMAVSAALAERLAKEGKKRAPKTSALLAMEPGEAWSLSVEGARKFARGDLTRIPSRLTVSAVELPELRVSIRATAYYDSPEQAAKALVFWDAIRRRYAAYPLVLLVGMGSILSDAVIEVKEQRLEGHTELSVQQVKVLLGLVKNALTPPPPQAPAPTPPAKEPAVLPSSPR